MTDVIIQFFDIFANCVFVLAITEERFSTYLCLLLILSVLLQVFGNLLLVAYTFGLLCFLVDLVHYHFALSLFTPGFVYFWPKTALKQVCFKGILSRNPLYLHLRLPVF